MTADEKPPTRNAILVLGMHRSGTSAITRVLSLLGADLPSELLEPVPDVNEAGFWESAKLVAIHDRMLAAAGSAWDDPCRIPGEFFESSVGQSFSDEILGVLEADFSESSLFVIKDPRICRFVPLWMEILERFECQALPLLLNRNPLEIAASLKRRDGFDRSKSLVLWLRHLLEMESTTRGLRRTLMDYEELLEDWQAAAARAGRELGLTWPKAPEEIAEEVGRFLSPSLRHHSSSASEVTDGAEVAPWVREAFEAWSRLRSSPRDSQALQEMDRIRAELDSASMAFGSLIGGQRERSLESALDQAEKALESLRSSLEDAERHNQLLEEGHAADKAAYEAQIESLEKAHVTDKRSYEAEIGSLEKAHATDKRSYEAEIERTRGLLKEFDDRIRNQTATIDELKASKQELQSEVRQFEQSFIEQRQENRERIEALERRAYETEALRERTARSARRLDVEKRELELALAKNRAEHDKTLQDKYWLYEQWQETKSQFEALRGSKIGRLLLGCWTGYLGTRRWAIRTATSLRQSPRAILVSSLGAARRAAGALVRAPARALRGIISFCGRGLGWLFLLFSTIREQATARLRRTRRAQAGIVKPEGSTVGSSKAIARSRRPRILMVSPYSIHPPSHGGAVRLFNLIRRLAEHCDLHLILFVREDDDPAQRAALEPYTKTLHFHRWEPRFDRDRFGLEAPSQRLFASDELARGIAQILSEEKIDILQLEFTELGQYGLPAFSRVKVAMSEIDIAFRSLQRRRSRRFHQRFESSRAFGHSFGDWMRQLRYELMVVRRADQVQMMSSADAEFLAAYLPDGHRRLRVVPNAVDTQTYRVSAVSDRNQRLLFVGNFEHLPNLDGIEHFFDEIWPEILRLRPGTEIAIVGANAPESLERFDALEGVELIGEVPELGPYYRQYRALVAPIRAGSGTRLKILEAFACGAPVISTRLGAEGIDCHHEQHLLLADDPAAFAKAAVAALDNDALCETLSRNCRRLVEESYTWEASAALQLAGYDELLSQPTTSTHHGSGHGTGGATGNDDSHNRTTPDPSTATAQQHSIDISVVIPTYNGGDRFRDCLEAIDRQKTTRSVEIICVDSGSAASDLESMRKFGARIIPIDKSEFDHGLTRDLGAGAAEGEVLVFLNQDAVPIDENWLSELTEPLFESAEHAAVQGAIRELPEAESRFYWDSCGDRFYFTRESDRWLVRFFGIGFSTVNAAVRRRSWEAIPFGRAPIMEDKKWQRRAVEGGASILYQESAAVFHSHDYGFGALMRRCQSEGFGWSCLGEEYSLLDMTRDMLQPRMYADLGRGLRQGRVRTGAELCFPLLRPLALYWGNHWSRGVKH